MATLVELAIAGAIFFVVLSILPYLTTIFGYNRRAISHGCGLVPVQYNYPFGLIQLFRHLRAWSNDDLLKQVLVQFRRHYYRTSRGMLAGTFWLNTIEPENIKAMLATSFNDFSIGRRHDAFHTILGDGIFTSINDTWKHSRAMLRPQFTREQVSRLESIHHHVNRLIDFHLRGGQSVNAQDAIHLMTMDTATDFLFGESTNLLDPELARKGLPGPQGNVTGMEFADAFMYGLRIIAFRAMLGPAWRLGWTPKLNKARNVCHNFMDYYVLKTLQKPMEKEETADRYIFIREMTKHTRDAVFIRDQAFNILLAGRDTTASLMSYLMYFMGAYPEVYQKLRNTVIDDFGPDDRIISFEELKHCKYLQNVLREVLRLHPTVPMNFRTAIRDTKLPLGGGPNGDMPVFVPKDTTVVFSAYAMQRDKTIWGPDADEFRPERWDEGRRAVASGWDYIPFGGGPRICLGQQFALTEAGFALSRICQEFSNIELVSPLPTDHDHLRQQTRLTCIVSGGVHVRFIE